MRVNHFDNLGKRFNMLTVKEISKQGKYYFYKCLCDCGNEKLISSSSILRGLSKSCGCIRNINSYENLVNRKFGRYTVISLNKKNGQRIFWNCKCECGNEKIVEGNNLRSGNTLSCGCLRKQRIAETLTTHGMSNSRLFKIWLKMKARCYKTTESNYCRYGGRGIRICEEWLKFENFKEWALQNGYSEELSIDRIDVNGNYCPENCRWADAKSQAQNRRNNVNITYKGKTICITELARILGIPHTTLARKLEGAINE